MGTEKSGKKSKASSQESEKNNKLQYKSRFSDPSTLVTFLIGKDEKKFILHKEFVCHHSSVLRAAFHSKFIEGQTQTYRLDDIRESTFRFFSDWVYTQDLDPVWLRAGYNLAEDSSKIACDEFFALPELWILADKFAMPKLQNATLKKIDNLLRREPGRLIALIPYVYDNSGSGSLLRKYFVTKCAHRVKVNGYKDYPEFFPKEMLLEMAIYAMPIDDDGERTTRRWVFTEFLVPED